MSSSPICIMFCEDIRDKEIDSHFAVLRCMIKDQTELHSVPFNLLIIAVSKYSKLIVSWQKKCRFEPHKSVKCVSKCLATILVHLKIIGSQLMQTVYFLEIN